MFAVKQIVLRPDDDAVRSLLLLLLLRWLTTSTARQSAATSKEIEVMKGIHHDNIVQYLGTLVKDNILNIFMEYIPPAITPYVPCGLAIG
jgi:serine/threonine protein kinase